MATAAYCVYKFAYVANAIYQLWQDADYTITAYLFAKSLGFIFKLQFIKVFSSVFKISDAAIHMQFIQ